MTTVRQTLQSRFTWLITDFPDVALMVIETALVIGILVARGNTGVPAFLAAQLPGAEYVLIALLAMSATYILLQRTVYGRRITLPEYYGAMLPLAIYIGIVLWYNTTQSGGGNLAVYVYFPLFVYGLVYGKRVKDGR